MASRSSRPRSASRGSRDAIARLLRDGVAVENPSDDVRAAAEELARKGLCTVTTREFVRCADPRDADFPPRNRSCAGRVFVENGLDEAGHDFKCPACERPVFPFRFHKRRHAELRAQIDRAGVTSFVRDDLAKLQVGVKDVAEGVMRVDLGDTGVFVCILDFCAERFHARDWAKANRACYVAVDAERADARFLPDTWLARVALADVVAGNERLADLVRRVATAEPPANVVEASVPVYSKTVPTIVAPQRGAGRAARRFVVEVGPKSVRIEGVDVMAPQAGFRFRVFQVLWEQFLDELRKGTAPDSHAPVKLSRIVKLLDERREKGEEDEATDEDSVRRAVNRLQADIETAFKRKVGDPIDREDIVETDRRANQSDKDFGYRINPRTVCARPFQTPTPGDAT